MSRAITQASALLVGALSALAGWVVVVPDPPAQLEVSGYVYPVGAPEGTGFDKRVAEAIELRARQLADDELVLRVDEATVALPVAEMGLDWDEETSIAEAKQALHQTAKEERGSFLRRLRRRFSGRAPIATVGLVRTLNQEKFRAALEGLSEVVDTDPVDAAMLISEHRIVPSVWGRRVSRDATVVRLAGSDLRGSVVLDAVVDRVSPRVTEQDLAPVDVTQVLASYVTSFRGKAGPRATNIRTAGKYLDGAVILPGEVLSFNERVGRRIHGRGFVDAPVIVNDELELDVGGGVCQVATTLHAAAVYGNIEVVRRRSHSRPSGYAPLGLDATVIDGKVDLRIRNPYEEPLLVHVSYPSRYEIQVELLGRSPEVKVDHSYAVTEREPFVRRVWHREEMPLGGVEKKQKGSEGMDVVSVLRIRHDDGRLVQRRYFSKYYPVPEVYWLGQGASQTALPELPEGAKALVVNGQEVAGEAEAPRPEKEVPNLNQADGGGAVDAE